MWQLVLGATQSRAAKDAHNRDENAEIDSGKDTEKQNQK